VQEDLASSIEIFLFQKISFFIVFCLLCFGILLLHWHTVRYLLSDLKIDEKNLTIVK